MKYPLRLIIPCFLVLLPLASCECEERVRKMISNPGERQEQVEKAKQRRSLGESSAPSEQEPNDFVEQATLVELGGDTRPIEGAIGDGDDEDWYALTSRNGESWQVELNVQPADDALDPIVRVEVASGDDAPIEYNLGSAGEAEVIPILGVSSVPQRILVAGADGSTGDYEISFQKRLSGGTVEAEPNDDIDAATRFEAPGEIQGFYDRPGDRDVFYVSREALEGDVFNLEVSPIAGLTQDVRVYTHRSFESTYLTFRVPPDRAAGVPNLALPPDVLGVWIVLTAGESYDRESSYRLKLLSHPPADHELEAEPNDTAAAAQKIELGARLAGYFHLHEDVDRFRVFVDGIPDGEPAEDDSEQAQPEEGEPSEGEPEEGEPSEGDADAVEEAESELEELEQDDEEQQGDGELEEPQLPPDPLEAVDDKEPPEHLVRVSAAPAREEDTIALGWGASAEGSELQIIEADEAGKPVVLCNQVVEDDSIDVEVRLLDAAEAGLQTGFDYRLVAEDVQSKEGLEIEPNGTREEADKLTAERPRTGYIAKSGDVDVYAFAVPHPAPEPQAEQPAEGLGEDDRAMRQPADAESAPAASPAPMTPRKVHLLLGANPLNLGFEVLDDEGGLIAEVNRAGAGAEERLSLDLPPGLYFVHVKARRGSSCEPYEISVGLDD